MTLNDTGMTECVGHRGSFSSDCAKSLQDAADGRDVHLADPDDGLVGFSFRKVCRSGEMAGEGSCPANPAIGSGPDDWGCVYDDVTRLTWETKTQDGGLHDRFNGYSNKGLKHQISDAAWLARETNAEALCGATSWRLPDSRELQSIVDYGNGTPGGRGGAWLDPTFFPNVGYGVTWTETVHVHDSNYGWYVDLARGDINIEKRFEKRGALLVHRSSHMPSRRGVLLVKDRFVPSTDGTEVTDTMTGLVWRRCTEGMVWSDSGQICSGHPNEYTWEQALDHAKANREGGWRIPNIKELFSIVDHKEFTPAIDPLAFPNAPNAVFLSSTTAYQASPPGAAAHVVAFGGGAVEQLEIYKYSYRFALRLVRRGRE